MKNNDKILAYTLARIGMGINFTCHGLVRIPKLNGFAEWMTSSFEKSMLPISFVKSFAYTLPFLELILGLLILTGLFSRWALAASSLLIISLILGSCLIENWEAIGFQMIYLASLAALLAFRQEYNSLSIDNRIS